MSSRFLISALAAVAAIVVVASPQDPSFEFPAAKHAGFNMPKQDVAVAEQAQTGGNVSVTFKNATVGEVLDWLKDQGVSFVIADGMVNKEARVNVHIVNEPMDAVIRAIGSMLGGHWQKKDGIWVFQKGSDVFGELGGGDVTFTTTPFKTDSRGEGGKDEFKVQDDGSRMKDLLLKEQSDVFQRAQRDGNDSKAWEEFARAWEKWAQDYEKNFQEFERNFKGQEFRFKMDDKAVLDLQKRAEELAKTGAKIGVAQDGRVRGYSFDGENFKPIDPKQLEEFRKQAEDMAKAGQKIRIDQNGKINGFTFDGEKMQRLNEKQVEEMRKKAEAMAKAGQQFRILHDGKSGGYTIDGQTLKPMDEKAMKDLQKRVKIVTDKANRIRIENGDGTVRTFTLDGNRLRQLNDKELKILKDRGDFKVMPFNNRTFNFKAPLVGGGTSAHNLKEIFDAMTPSQEQKMKRLGYINYSDLNAKQRALLGVITDENWTISYKTDKASLTIKSDR